MLSLKERHGTPSRRRTSKGRATRPHISPSRSLSSSPSLSPSRGLHTVIYTGPDLEIQFDSAWNESGNSARVAARCGTATWSTARRALLILSARNVIEKFARRVWPDLRGARLENFQNAISPTWMRFLCLVKRHRRGDIEFFAQILLEIFKSESKKSHWSFRQTNQPSRGNITEYLTCYLASVIRMLSLKRTLLLENCAYEQN